MMPRSSKMARNWVRCRGSAVIRHAWARPRTCTLKGRRSRRIDCRTRYFIPTEPEAAKTIQGLTENRLITSLVDPSGPQFARALSLMRTGRGTIYDLSGMNAGVRVKAGRSGRSPQSLPHFECCDPPRLRRGREVLLASNAAPTNGLRNSSQTNAPHIPPGGSASRRCVNELVQFDMTIVPTDSHHASPISMRYSFCSSRTLLRAASARSRRQ